MLVKRPPQTPKLGKDTQAELYMERCPKQCRGLSEKQEPEGYLEEVEKVPRQKTPNIPVCNRA